VAQVYQPKVFAEGPIATGSATARARHPLRRLLCKGHGADPEKRLTLTVIDSFY